MLQLGQHYQQPNNDYAGTITRLKTVKKEFGTYQLVFYLFQDDKHPTCDIYRLSDAGDVLLGFVTPYPGLDVWWCYILYPEEDWALKSIPLFQESGVALLLDKSERDLENHFIELYG